MGEHEDTFEGVARPHHDDEQHALDLLHGLLGDKQGAVLRRIFDAVPDAIIVHRPDGRILYYNDGACALLGRTREEMNELGAFGWVAHDAMHGSAGRLETILHEGSLTFESASVRADGSTAPTEVSAKRLDTEDGPVIVAVVRDISERQEAQRQLVYLAFHDPLTGLSNRRAFEERLRIAISDAKRHRDLLAVAYIDLDQFKPINDAFGHETGDAVLVTIGHRLVASVREQDLVARIGGDEFVLMLPRLNDAGELMLVAERLLDAIRAPIMACGNDCRVEASIGFAVFDPEVDDTRSLVVKADLAMYAAKRDEHNSWLLWTPATGGHRSR